MSRVGLAEADGQVAEARTDGHQGASDLTASPITSPTANLAGASIWPDIPDKKQPEVAPRQPEEQYRLLFECNPIPMWVFNRSTLRFLAVNKASIRQYGFTEQEFLAKTIAEIRPEQDIPELLRDVAERKLGIQERGYWRHRKKDGTVIDVEIVCHPLDFQGVESTIVWLVRRV
jgi:PAS domain S-box-containing protein